jgi:hypothetical protein
MQFHGEDLKSSSLDSLEIFFLFFFLKFFSIGRILGFIGGQWRKSIRAPKVLTAFIITASN